MERPEHTLRGAIGTSAELAPRRFGGLVIATIIHIGIVAVLIVGLVGNEMEKKKEDIQATVEQQKVEPKAPPPPPPDVVKPPPPFIPPPDFQIQTDAPAPTNSITSTQVRPPVPPPPAPPPAPPAPPAAPPTPPEIIAATHTQPPYPTISQRLGEQGTSLLNITIDENGRCTEATVATSSGSNRLDTAAIDYVKQRYRWKPATQGGKPVAIRTQIKVVWSLKDAQ
jgi:protein TonB